MALPEGVREFAPEQIDTADTYLRDLPDHVTRVYVDVWDGGDWRFVFGDDRDHAMRGIRRHCEGSRFRIRPG